jgi:hypothetical protein
MVEALAKPLFEVPDAADALAVAFPAAAGLELDGPAELAVECGPQPATASPAAAIAAARTAGL